MNARKKINRIDPPEYANIRDKVTSTTTNADEIENIEKDFHLLQAALATDQTIISLSLMRPSVRAVGFLRERLNRSAKSEITNHLGKPR